VVVVVVVCCTSSRISSRASKSIRARVGAGVGRAKRREARNAGEVRRGAAERSDSERAGDREMANQSKARLLVIERETFTGLPGRKSSPGGGISGSPKAEARGANQGYGESGIDTTRYSRVCLFPLF
jgi:hypothetical protein